MSAVLNEQLEANILTLTLNDPERRNALSPELVDALVDALGRAGANPEVRCIVLTGAGPAFSAGGNPKRMLKPGLYPDMSPLEIQCYYRAGIQRLPLALDAVEVPIIAAVNGPAIGAGCDVACFCDVRIASHEATFTTSFVKLGLVPGDGGAWILPRVIGSQNASRMLLTGTAVNATEALQMGLVCSLTSAEQLLPTARALAASVAANPPHAVRLTKKLIRNCRTTTLAGALEISSSVQALCHKTEDHREAVTAFLEKRPAVFAGH
jgi:enoyl-CoA hydratase/carnithine racemase